MSFFNELKRRNVLRVGAAYVVAAWLLIQVAETIFPLFGFDDTPARIIVIVLAIGFIPALIFAWAFEMTPEGLKKESEVDRTSSIAPRTGKKLDRMIMVVLALALGYFAFDNFVLDPQREAELKEENLVAIEQALQKGRTEGRVEYYGDKSIAVLAFDDMSQAGDQEYLSDGIAEELLNLLAKIPELRVISRSSAFSYKGKDIKLAQMGKELNVAHILEGSVRKAGNRVRITAQLIEARSDTHLWSETYDRQLEDIFAIQDEIAATVVEQLKITLLGEAPHVQEVDPEAYALYLQARHLARLRSTDSINQSNILYEQSLAIDPKNPAAWAGLAVNYHNMVSSGQITAVEGFGRARDATNKALAIDPEYVQAHNNLGWEAMDYSGDLAQAARHFERALQIDPNNAQNGDGSVLLLNLGRLDQAIANMQYRIARDPVNSVAHNNLGYAFIYAGRWMDAVAAFENALRLSPDYVGAHYGKGSALLYMGESEAALAEFQQESFEAYRLIGLAMVHHTMDDVDLSNQVLEELIAKHETGFAYNIAYVLAFRHNADPAFEWLEKAVEYHDSGLSDIVIQPAFDNIRDDPRWLPFLESIGRSPEQLAAIEFKVTLPQ